MPLMGRDGAPAALVLISTRCKSSDRVLSWQWYSFQLLEPRLQNIPDGNGFKTLPGRSRMVPVRKPGNSSVRRPLACEFRRRLRSKPEAGSKKLEALRCDPFRSDIGTQYLWNDAPC